MEQQPSSFGGASITEALPYDVLEIILKYLPKKDLESFALACKAFYELVCEVERYKRPVVLTNFTEINEEFVEGMLLSKRKFETVEIRATMQKTAYTKDELSRISRVLQNIPTIKVLKVKEVKGPQSNYWYNRSSSFYEPNDLEELMDLIPNLETIQIDYIHLRTSIIQKIASMAKLQQLLVKFDCTGQRWTPTIENELKNMIPRLKKYKIDFDRLTNTIIAALQNFGARRNYMYWRYGLPCSLVLDNF